MFGQLSFAPALCIIQIKPKYLCEAVERLKSARLKSVSLIIKEVWVTTGALSITKLDISKVKAGWAGFWMNREQL